MEMGLLKVITLFKKDIRAIGIDKEDMTVPDGIEFLKTDILRDRIPLDDESIDYIFMNHVVEHLHEPAVVLSELRRILKSGGMIYMEAPSIRSCYLPSVGFKLQDGIPINFYDDPSHIRPYSKCALWHLLKNWFRPVKTGYAMNWFKFVCSPFNIMKAFVLRDRLNFARGVWALVGWAVYIVAEKE